MNWENLNKKLLSLFYWNLTQIWKETILKQYLIYHAVVTDDCNTFSNKYLNKW